MKGQETQTESLQITADAWAGRLLDISEREARARPRHHQLVPSQYRTWWGHGPKVRGKGGMVWWWGEGKRSICRTCPSPFGKYVLLGWQTTQKRRVWGGAVGCMPWEWREKAFIPWQERSATVRGELKPASVWQEWVAHTSGGWQVRPDQTKAVKGQNGKTLVTAGTIKRLLPCLVTGIEKNRAFLRSEKKNRVRRKEKKDKKENRKEKKEN